MASPRLLLMWRTHLLPAGCVRFGSLAIHEPDFLALRAARLTGISLVAVWCELFCCSKTFECLDLAFAAGRRGGLHPAAMNAANEEAVAQFLDKRIHFTEISAVIKHVMRQADSHLSSKAPSDITLEVCLQLYAWESTYAILQEMPHRAICSRSLCRHSYASVAYVGR